MSIYQNFHFKNWIPKEYFLHHKLESKKHKKQHFTATKLIASYIRLIIDKRTKLALKECNLADYLTCKITLRISGGSFNTSCHVPQNLSTFLSNFMNLQSFLSSKLCGIVSFRGSIVLRCSMCGSGGIPSESFNSMPAFIRYSCRDVKIRKYSQHKKENL